MKRATLLLGFIKGPLVDDWVKRWTQWAINQFAINHRPPTDEYYWTEISNGFQTAFQDTGARERAEKELHILRWDPESVDTFLARFESLAEAADFELNANPTKSILAKCYVTVGTFTRRGLSSTVALALKSRGVLSSRLSRRSAT
jgi:hypothetical protein